MQLPSRSPSVVTGIDESHLCCLRVEEDEVIVLKIAWGLAPAALSFSSPLGTFARDFGVTAPCGVSLACPYHIWVTRVLVTSLTSCVTLTGDIAFRGTRPENVCGLLTDL